jgi:hypothetical protein
MVVKIDAFGLPAGRAPPEDQPPLIVDTDRAEPCQLASQLLEMVARRHAQVLVRRRVIDHLELAEESAFEIGRDEPRARIIGEEGAQPFVSEAHDHRAVPLYVSMYHSSVQNATMEIDRPVIPHNLVRDGRLAEAWPGGKGH